MGFVDVAAVAFASGLYDTKSTLLPHQNTHSYQYRIELFKNSEFQDKENKMFHKEENEE